MGETTIRIPCGVSARVLWENTFAPALVRVAPNRRALVWVSRNDLVIDHQEASEELSAYLVGSVVHERDDTVVLKIWSRGVQKELEFSRIVLDALNALRTASAA
jgi:hypothetical protein